MNNNSDDEHHPKGRSMKDKTSKKNHSNNYPSINDGDFSKIKKKKGSKKSSLNDSLLSST